MRRATAYFVNEVASHGGYVYYYSPDLTERWGEGKAAESQIWVQQPGTPLVGMTFLAAYRATGDGEYLEAATQAGEALIYGQLVSGGWTNAVDFEKGGERVAKYRNGQGEGKNFSSLDDGITQGALQFLMRLDEAKAFQHEGVHGAVQFGLNALLDAQFENGAFPQGWDGPVFAASASVPASFPKYDWRTEGRIKAYWGQYTLNDNVAGEVCKVLMEAERIYGEARFREALTRLGEFLVLAQLPSPQRAWAQQYNEQMQPIWARAFEPPAIASDETQEVIDTLMDIAVHLREARFLKPIPKALGYLRKSALSSGQLARFYELETNTPLYMRRSGKVYSLTYEDDDLPGHYGWKIESRLPALEARYQRIMNKQPDLDDPVLTEVEISTIVDGMDDRSRWLSTYGGELIVGQPDWKPGYVHISSQTFAENMMRLSRYLMSLSTRR